MFCTACCSEAHPACFVSCRSPFFDVSFPDVSNYFLRGAGRCFWPCKPWASSPLADIKQEHCQCMLLCLSVGWFHSVSVCLSVCLSLFSWRCALRPALLCTVYDPPSFPSSFLASVRSRLIAGVELYIQVNSWEGWPLLNACVLCLYHIHSLLLHSECWHGYTLWVLQSLLGWTLRFCAWSCGRAVFIALTGSL